MDPALAASARVRLRPALTVLVVIAALMPAVAIAAPPTADETATFTAILGRIGARPPATLPRGVAGALNTFQPGCWTSTVQCPAGGEISCIKYTVCTELVAWSAAAAGGEQGAAYIWDTAPDITIEDGCKVIVMNNQIMIDQAALAGDEANAIGQTLNEALVYHELLHAQLGIDALGAAIIVNPVCQCAGPNPASQSDKGHTVIPGLQDGYVISAGAANGVNVQVVRIQVPATGNAFALQIPVAKPKYSIQAVQTSNGNVASIHVGDRGDDGKVPVTGTLEDPAQGGSVIIMIDPPVSWEYLYVELVPAPTPAQRRSWGEIKQIYR